MITDVKRGCGTGRVILINAGLLAGVLMLEARSSKLEAGRLLDLRARVNNAGGFVSKSMMPIMNRPDTRRRKHDMLHCSPVFNLKCQSDHLRSL
ncbi:hypothetical protein PI124_g15861 [Phytophthora idaei]|nr:hypothetical protein PI124_g15861 [Phytophthora idaei]